MLIKCKTKTHKALIYDCIYAVDRVFPKGYLVTYKGVTYSIGKKESKIIKQWARGVNYKKSTIKNMEIIKEKENIVITTYIGWKIKF